MAGDSRASGGGGGDDIERETTTAETPLLGTGEAADPHGDDPAAPYRQRVVILSLSIVFLISLGAGLLAPPCNAIMEDIICKDYHPEVVSVGLSNDPVCKNPDVQGRLATIRGWGATFDCLPGIIATVPYGVLSDKWGRKPVLLLSLIGFTLSIFSIAFVLWFSNIFPVWTVWLSAIFLLIGGSGSVTQAMLFTVLADVVPVAERATVFFHYMAAYLLPGMISSPLAGVLMRRSPWIPVLLGILFLVLSTLTSLLYPETLELRKLREDARAGGDEVDPADPAALASKPDVSTLQKSMAKAREDLAEVWKFILGNRRIMILMISVGFFSVGRFVQEMLLQYASKRYGWTWDEAAIFLTIYGAANVVILILVLPAISWVCLNYLNMAALSKDLWLARFSAMIQVTGALLIAFSFNAYFLSFSLVVFAGGGGLTSLLRSLMNSLVEEHHVGTLNTLVSFMETVGLMIAGPTLSQAIRIGIEIGEPWIGLPFICAALLFAVVTVIVWLFRLPRPRLSV